MTTVTPIQALPDEILQDIFTLHLQDLSRQFLLISDYYFSRNALRLVCRWWNAIVVHSAVLWSHIKIPFYGRPVRFPPPRILRQWIHRSGKAPLHIKLSSGGYHDPEVLKMLQGCLDILAHAIDHWHNVEIGFRSMPLNYLMDFIAKCSFDQARALRRLVIHLPENSGTLHVLPIARQIGEIPNLSRLEWSPLDLACAQALMDYIPLAKLSALFLMGASSLAPLSSVICKASSVTHLELVLPKNYNPAEQFSTTKLSLPRLRSLHLTTNCYTHLFFRILAAPLLAVLCLWCHWQDRRLWPETPAHAKLSSYLPLYLASSPHSLHVLMLRGLKYSLSELGPLLQSPHIARLSVLEIFGRPSEVVKKAVDECDEVPPDIRNRCVIRDDVFQVNAKIVGWVEPKWVNLLESTPFATYDRLDVDNMSARVLRWSRVTVRV